VTLPFPPRAFELSGTVQTSVSFRFRPWSIHLAIDSGELGECMRETQAEERDEVAGDERSFAMRRILDSRAAGTMVVSLDKRPDKK
jgi:hypothetical protein